MGNVWEKVKSLERSHHILNLVGGNLESYVSQFSKNISVIYGKCMGNTWVIYGKYMGTVWAYILKIGFAGSQEPQKNLNILQKDCLRMRKLSILQCVLEIQVKRKDCCHSTHRYTHHPTTTLVVINTLLELF